MIDGEIFVMAKLITGGTNNSKVICTLCMVEFNYHKSTISVIIIETWSVSVTIVQNGFRELKLIMSN